MRSEARRLRLDCKSVYRRLGKCGGARKIEGGACGCGKKKTSRHAMDLVRRAGSVRCGSGDQLSPFALSIEISGGGNSGEKRCGATAREPDRRKRKRVFCRWYPG